MDVNSVEFNKLNDLFWMWLSMNDLDQNAIKDPVRAAAFGFYAAKNVVGYLIDQWDIRDFIQLQLDSDSMFGEMQKA